MPISPLMEDTTAFNFRILIDGKQLDDSIDIFKIEVNSKLGEIPSATVIFVFQVERALLAAMEKLAPGKNMELRMGYNGRDERLFSGIATNQSIATRESQGFTLVVDFQDKAFTLDQELDKQLFRDLTDAEIIGTIINENGLPSDVDDTNVRHQQLSQFQMTDWDFIQARAKANNLLAYAENGKIFVKARATSSAPALLLTLGEDVIGFKLNTKASDLQSLRVSARNMLAKKKSVARKSRRVPGNTQSSAPAHTITGEVTFTGNATPQLNSTIQLAEFGPKFNGKHLITGFHHLAEAGQWQTTVDIGPVAAPARPTAPQLPGILPGKVVALEGDPLDNYRILVDVPELDTTGTGIWSHLASFYATAGKGAIFVPEIGDEVILGFEGNDLAQPVVLGSLYGSAQAPPSPVEDDNHLKGILTRSGLKLEFDDEKQQLTLATPANNTIVLSDGESRIDISDQHGNQITMDHDGIKIKSCSNIELDAPGKIVAKAMDIELDAQASFSAQGNAIELDAPGKIVAKAMDIELDAQASFSAQGNAQAEFTSNGMATVKGAMVLIN